MSMMIEAYAFEQPTYEGLLASLGQVMAQPEVETVVTRARRELGFGKLPFDHLDSGQLLRVAEHLTHQRGLVSIVARSFAIRVATHRELADMEHRS